MNSGPPRCCAPRKGGNVNAVKVLLAKGANPGVKNNTGDTPSSAAHVRSHTAVIEALEQQAAENKGGLFGRFR